MLESLVASSTNIDYIDVLDINLFLVFVLFIFKVTVDL